MKKNLIIIGGGYAGTALVKNLKNSFNITLLDKNKEHVEQTEIHRYLGGKISLNKFVFSYKSFAKKHSIEFIQTNVKHMNFETKEIFCENETFIYDYLIIATGSKTFFPKQIKNLTTYEEDIKELKTILNFKNNFENLLQPNVQNKNIIIAGAGLSGVEIAIELAQRVKKEKMNKNNIQITLIEQQKTVLPGNNNYLIKKSQSALNALQVNCVHGAFITQIHKNKIVLSNNQELSCDLSLFVLGVSSQALSNEQKIKHNIKNQYIVNEYFQIEPYKNVFCLGDAAQTTNAQGTYNLPTAQMANAQANLLSENLKNNLKNEKMKKNKLNLKGVLIDLGENAAVGLLGNLKLNGYIVYLIKRLTSYQHKVKF